MELTIKDEMTVGKFTIKNYNEIKTNLTTILAKYTNLVVDENSLKDAKSIRAELNKVGKAINNRRLELEREYLKPFNEGKEQCNELVELVKQTSLAIDNQIKEIEEAHKQAKREQMLSLYQELCENRHFDLLSFEAMEKKEYYNATYTLNKIEEDLTQQIVATINDLSIVDNAYKDTSIRNEVKVEYLALKENHNDNALAKAMQIINEKIAQKNKLEQQARLEKEIKTTSCQKFEIRYIIKGTKEELRQVSSFLKTSGIEYNVESK